MKAIIIESYRTKYIFLPLYYIYDIFWQIDKEYSEYVEEVYGNK